MYNNNQEFSPYMEGNNSYESMMAMGGKAPKKAKKQDDQIMQIIQAYAQAAGVDPQQVIAELQKMPPEQQQSTLQKMAQALQQQPQQEQQMQPQMQQQMQPQMRNGGNFVPEYEYAYGGAASQQYAVGQTLDISPNQVESLRQQGYTFDVVGQ